MKKYFLAILVIIQCIPLFSQVSAGSLQQSFCEVSSPESFAMTKYGAVHSSMYTGAFSYNLPVYIYIRILILRFLLVSDIILMDFDQCREVGLWDMGGI